MTNIAGIDFPEDVLDEATAVADELDRIMPELMPLLDRAAASYNAIEIALCVQTRWDATDEQHRAVDEQTALGRIVEHWYAVQERTSDPMLKSEEFRRVEQEYFDSEEAREHLERIRSRAS